MSHLHRTFNTKVIDSNYHPPSEFSSCMRFDPFHPLSQYCHLRFLIAHSWMIIFSMITTICSQPPIPFGLSIILSPPSLFSSYQQLKSTFPPQAYCHVHPLHGQGCQYHHLYHLPIKRTPPHPGCFRLNSSTKTCPPGLLPGSVAACSDRAIACERAGGPGCCRGRNF